MHTIYDLWNKKVNRRVNTMHSIKITPLWLFPHVEYKSISLFSPFALTYAPLLTISWMMSTYPHKAWLDNTCLYVNVISCWNKYFLPKGDNDMMQCVTCKILFICTKTTERQILQMFLRCKKIIHSYMKLRHKKK